MSLSLQDQLDIQQLLARYTHAADLLPPEAMREVFSEDGRFQITAMDIDIQGIDNIIKFFTDMRADTPGMFHINSNLVIEGEGDSATALSYLQIVNTNEGAALAGLARYRDELQRTADGWRLSTRAIEF